jgi:ATP-dependent Lon protease
MSTLIPDQEESTSVRLPLLPLREVVVFPGMVVPLLIGRPASLAAVEESIEADLPIFLCAQKDPEEERPRARDLYRIGCAGNILQTLRMPDGSMKVVVEGLGRARVRRFYLNPEYSEALIEKVRADAAADARLEGYMRAALNEFEDYVRLSQRVAPDILLSIQGMEEADMLADAICAWLPLPLEERQELLEIVRPAKRLEKTAAVLVRENDLIRLEQNVRDRVRQQVERGQREHYLNEQLKAIHEELGSREEGGDEYSELRAMIEKAGMPADIEEKAWRELGRYERMPPFSPESAIIRTFLEWLTDMPWKKRSRDRLDIARAERVLNEDHYGLEKVKERILEFLAVRKLNRNVKGPILCLVGPPGVGKTSLGESIARAMKRQFVRVSLGGIRDEAEIRGHRRTYIGAMPGRIIQSMKKAGVRNPVFMLDEVDKMNADFRGDPASALLEVLDPAQNHAFSDHFLEVDYDLSEVFFIATANNEYDIPAALHDRMEIVRLPGYTIYEKEKIARLFLIPRQMADAGLDSAKITFSDNALDYIIQRYTREAGVRELERQLAAVNRKLARRKVAKKLPAKTTLDKAMAEDLLGPPRYSELRAETRARPGVATGMAWTEAGGDILIIETGIMKGKGRLQLTGRLGDVMKESAEAAFSWLRAHADEYKLPADFHKNMDIHVHVPEGAIPKDGPSAGTALVVSMLSALRAVAPADAIAMTGEITLRGRVLPVGGVKSKILAAHRAGIRKIILPEENRKDFPEIPEEVRNDVEFTLVSDLEEVLAAVFPEKKPRGKKKAAAAS